MFLVQLFQLCSELSHCAVSSHIVQRALSCNILKHLNTHVNTAATFQLTWLIVFEADTQHNTSFQAVNVHSCGVHLTNSMRSHSFAADHKGDMGVASCEAHTVTVTTPDTKVYASIAKKHSKYATVWV